MKRDLAISLRFQRIYVTVFLRDINLALKQEIGSIKMLADII